MFIKWFSPWFGVRFDEAADGGVGGGNEKPPDKPDGQKPGDTEKKPDKPGEHEDEIQKRVNELLPDRARQARRSLVGDLGFESEDDLKNALADLKKRQDGEKTDAQKATERASELEAAVEQQKAENRRLRIERDVERVARELKFRDPQDALVHIQAELKDIEIGEDGKVKGLDELLKKLAKAKAYLIDATEKPDIDSRTNHKAAKEKDEEKLKQRFGLS